MRSSNFKLFFLSSIGGCQHPDVRLKLLGRQSLNRRLEVRTACGFACTMLSGAQPTRGAGVCFQGLMPWFACLQERCLSR